MKIKLLTTWQIKYDNCSFFLLSGKYPDFSEITYVALHEKYDVNGQYFFLDIIIKTYDKFIAIKE